MKNTKFETILALTGEIVFLGGIIFLILSSVFS